jgi:2-dehydro-3-deoxygalactonokinase
MSGEECEIYGIIDALGIKEDFIAVLPGSYLKSMEVNAEGKIESIKTGMCGEIIAAVSQHTILKKSIPEPVIREVVPEKLIFGYEYCKTHGVSPSLIKTRNAMLHLGMSQNDAANFFVGAILYHDVLMTAELCRGGKKVVIGGSDPLKTVFDVLLTHVGVTNIVKLDDEVARLAPNLGAMRVYERYLELNK